MIDRVQVGNLGRPATKMTGAMDVTVRTEDGDLTAVVRYIFAGGVYAASGTLYEEDGTEVDPGTVTVVLNGDRAKTRIMDSLPGGMGVEWEDVRPTAKLRSLKQVDPKMAAVVQHALESLVWLVSGGD